MVPIQNSIPKSPEMPGVQGLGAHRKVETRVGIRSAEVFCTGEMMVQRLASTLLRLKDLELLQNS